MIWKYLIQICILLICTADGEVKMEKVRRNNDYGDKSLWKKEYEKELNDAMQTSRKRDNITRVPQAASFSDSEGVVEKLMDSITSSEKYLKKVDSIDFRLNRLDIEVHEKTNSIMKHLAELTKGLQNDHTKKLEALLQTLKNEIYHIKFMVENNPRNFNAGNDWNNDFFSD